MTMKATLQKYRLFFSERGLPISTLISLVLLLCSAVINFYAGVYAAERASNSVTDLILSNIRTYDLDGIFVYGSYFLAIFITLLCLLEPMRIAFVAKSLALFIFIRSIFMSLTHFAPFPSQINIDPARIFHYFSSGSDLFFSGHAGIPFLMALIFWKNRALRILFIAISIFFGIVVLLAHLHYSIDVLSAFFITYTIYHMALFFFKKDAEVFENGLSLE